MRPGLQAAEPAARLVPLRAASVVRHLQVDHAAPPIDGEAAAPAGAVPDDVGRRLPDGPRQRRLDRRGDGLGLALDPALDAGGLQQRAGRVELLGQGRLPEAGDQVADAPQRLPRGQRHLPDPVAARAGRLQGGQLALQDDQREGLAELVVEVAGDPKALVPGRQALDLVPRRLQPLGRRHVAPDRHRRRPEQDHDDRGVRGGGEGGSPEQRDPERGGGDGGHERQAAVPPEGGARDDGRVVEDVRLRGHGQDVERDQGREGDHREHPVVVPRPARHPEPEPAVDGRDGEHEAGQHDEPASARGHRGGQDAVQEDQEEGHHEDPAESELVRRDGHAATLLHVRAESRSAYPGRR
jgi:hypothetical protein